MQFKNSFPLINTEQAKSWFQQNLMISKNKRTFFLLTLCYSIYVLPIILAARPYNDDLARTYYGATGWVGDGRPLTELIQRFLCGGKNDLASLAPLPLILSVILFSYSVTLYAQNHGWLQNGKATEAPYLFLAITSPLFLANLSYEYDCITMMIAICAALACFSLTSNVLALPSVLFQIVMCMLILTTYQLVIGLFLALVLVEILLEILNFQKINWRLPICRIIIVGLCVLIYKFFIASATLDTSGWRVNAAEVALGKELLVGIGTTLIKLALLCKDWFKGASLILLLFLVTFFVVFSIISCKRIINFDRSKKDFNFKTFAKCLYCVFSIPLIAIAAISPLFALKNYALNCRACISLLVVPFLMGIMGIYIRKRALAIGLLIPYFCFSLTFSYAYGNVMQSQKAYENYLVYSILEDYKSAEQTQQITQATIVGQAPLSPYAKRIIKKFPLMESLVPCYLDNSGWIGGVLLYQFLDKPLPYCELTDQDKLAMEAAPLAECDTYACYINNDKLILYWK